MEPKTISMSYPDIALCVGTCNATNKMLSVQNFEKVLIRYDQNDSFGFMDLCKGK